MRSFHKPATRAAVLVIVILLLVQSNTVGGHPYNQSQDTGRELKATEKPECPTTRDLKGQSMYGLGVRVGSYLQGFAFCLGSIKLQELDPKTQFSGIILAFQLLVRLWTSFHADQISSSELWVGFAQLILFTTPGSFLLFLSFSFQRRHWRTKKGWEMQAKEVIRGEGLNFLQVFTTLAWVNVTNVFFTGILYLDWAPATILSENHVWMLQNLLARSA